MSIKLPLPRHEYDYGILSVDDDDVAALERAYALLRARCEAVENYVEVHRNYDGTQIMWDDVEKAHGTWMMARAAHREVDGDA